MSRRRAEIRDVDHRQRNAASPNHGHPRGEIDILQHRSISKGKDVITAIDNNRLAYNRRGADKMRMFGSSQFSGASGRSDAPIAATLNDT